MTGGAKGWVEMIPIVPRLKGCIKKFTIESPPHHPHREAPYRPWNYVDSFSEFAVLVSIILI